jgi:hypothetical protein
MKLIDALLASSSGPKIRDVLQLRTEGVFTEVLYVKVRRVAEQAAVCEVRVCIAKLEDGSVAQNAVEVVFRCLEVSFLDWHSSFYEVKDISGLEPLASELEIDTDDSFRLLCRAIEVVDVRPEKLRATLDENKA